ncbi:tRNA (cytosine(32)/uridine(32)-2'-O)-methyltransferase TrmJ [Motiliproteus sp. SC1-56]|uniref:tRNA (cytosine(32)/uridine(32)-2'-O)-methyltransferase TrmJ n=1 Tax=Motiliproteus sp. SC1-56 TaxID=2799565 RepID=UPI001A90BF42|nr:tRNA (cytosine(32)/uridine(32)-2'-O)-methyltransferase TrmJ [Motiliproteus sp. SC1-56]
MLANIRIVLTNTFHPGNIGAAARALKTMGLSQLYLVAPRCYPDPEATARAAGATDILEQARVVNTLEEAIADCPLVIGTSARSRSLPWPMLDARSCGEKVVREAAQGPVAVVFGRERMGLHNDELRQCHFHLAIPADPAYPVLNVSAAVQIVCYEIWQAAQGANVPTPENEGPFPPQAEMAHFYQHLEQTLREIDFLVPQHPGNTLTKLQRLFNRARPEVNELKMLRGILSAVQRSRR